MRHLAHVASTNDERSGWSDAGTGAVAGVAFALLTGGALLSLRRRTRALGSTRGGALCVILAAAIALAPPGAAGAGSSTTYSDPAGDAGRAPDLASVTLTALDPATLGVKVELAEPTTLDRYTWVLIGIDTDRNQRTGGMHGSEAIVFVNGEHAVLYRLGRRFVPVHATLDGAELTFPLRFDQLGARTFDFAVATLRHDADVAPDRGVFSFPPASRHDPAERDLRHSEKRPRHPPEAYDRRVPRRFVDPSRNR